MSRTKNDDIILWFELNVFRLLNFTLRGERRKKKKKIMRLHFFPCCQLS